EAGRLQNLYIHGAASEKNGALLKGAAVVFGYLGVAAALFVAGVGNLAYASSEIFI
ncbi:hypothetical protein Tco_1424370, partial [Tanacetum coccineum]